MQDKSKITDRFNETGFPFQQWCLETIRNFGKDHGGWKYKAVSEWPFTHPPSNGPLLGVHSTADIVAAKGVSGISDKTLLFLVFECKRANTSIKNWVFTKDKQDKKPVFILSEIDSQLNETIYISRNLTFPNLKYLTSDSFDYCNNVVELNEKFSTLNRNQEEKVYKAIRQVNHSIYALERKKPKYIENLTTGINLAIFRYFVFLPVIVTTANLYIADFDYNGVTRGDVPDKNVNYEEKKWLTYEFPLPDFLGYGRTSDNVAIEKRTTLIVNDKALLDFLNAVSVIDGLGIGLKD